jgi:hypothetical protein
MCCHFAYLVDDLFTPLIEGEDSLLVSDIRLDGDNLTSVARVPRSDVDLFCRSFDLLEAATTNNDLTSAHPSTYPTLAPFTARAMAIPLPMPLPPPVTMQVCTSVCDSFLARLRCGIHLALDPEQVLVAERLIGHGE